MERDRELTKLINVLRRTSRMAIQAERAGGSQDAARYCVEQYNRVLARLREIDEGVNAVFEPLPEGSSLTVSAMACRQLAAYYEDEVGAGGAWSAAYGINFDPEPFKDFWRKSAREVEDFGEFIRESIEEWTRQRKTRGCRSTGETGAKETKTTSEL